MRRFECQTGGEAEEVELNTSSSQLSVVLWAAYQKQPFFWINLFYLEAIKGDKQPQDVVGAFEDPEYSQISHHSLHSGILQRHRKFTSAPGRKAARQNEPTSQVLFRLRSNISTL